MSPRFTIRPLSAQPDARLAELSRAGDERAFELLVRRHRRGLARYCRRLGLPEHRVEDVLQQALTRAWLALDRGVEVREARAWLYRIVHNAALNSIRGERRHAHESIDTVLPAHTPHAAGEIDGPLRARDALGRVAALPELQRDAIVLTAIEGRSHEEAAGLLGVSDGAVRGLLYRARTTLRSAAAALSPQGLLSLLGRASGDGAAERAAELSAGGAAVGAAGMLGKGLLATGVAGLLAAGGTIAHLQSGNGSHAKRVAPAASVAETGRSRGQASAAAPTGLHADRGRRTGRAEDRGRARGRHRGRGRSGSSESGGGVSVESPRDADDATGEGGSGSGRGAAGGQERNASTVDSSRGGGGPGASGPGDVGGPILDDAREGAKGGSGSTPGGEAQTTTTSGGSVDGGGETGGGASQHGGGSGPSGSDGEQSSGSGGGESQDDRDSG
jgi:RNA polymerase sigma factor (sigma-70 family)